MLFLLLEERSPMTGVVDLVDPQERAILVFLPEQLLNELVGDEILPVLPDLALGLTVNDVLGWLKGRQFEIA
ncbi:MAG: hypothetical protein HC833_24545 [Leptolyngbyaceae cyanobacterium RM1_406_9]|nr:hypothetical protein [Leptolyngbyaceae cyanobacterium RM1_406_9]